MEKLSVICIFVKTMKRLFLAIIWVGSNNYDSGKLWQKWCVNM